MKKALVDYLLQDEPAYVEEISRICLQPDFIEVFIDDQMNGWLYMPGEAGSADWNLARLIGDAQRATLLMQRLPPIELQLLVPAVALNHFAEWQALGSILWFTASLKEKVGCPECPEGFVVRTRQVLASCKEFQAFFPEIYLFSDNRMVGFIKTIRETHTCFEVYIEVAPAFRGRGLGQFLLQAMLAQAEKIGKRLTYAVANDNQASLGLAKSAGLQKFNELFRITRKS